MIDSILDSIKKALGLDAEYDAFDEDVIMHINTAMTTLHQLGVGPPDGYQIESAAQEWPSFLGESPLMNGAKTYIYDRVRMEFDPPGTSYHLNALEKRITELEWRFSVGDIPYIPAPLIPGADPLQDHINSPTPHPAYDNAEDFGLLVENELI